MIKTAYEVFFDQEDGFTKTSTILLSGISWSSNKAHADCHNAQGRSDCEVITIVGTPPLDIEPSGGGGGTIDDTEQCEIDHKEKETAATVLQMHSLRPPHSDA